MLRFDIRVLLEFVGVLVQVYKREFKLIIAFDFIGHRTGN